MSLFIVEVAEFIKNIQIPEGFDWSDTAINTKKGEIILPGTANDELLRMFYMVESRRAGLEAMCEETGVEIKKILNNNGVLPQNNPTLFRLVVDHETQHSYFKALERLFWEEVKKQFPDAIFFEEIRLRKGCKVIGLKRWSEFPLDILSDEESDSTDCWLKKSKK